MTRGLAPIGRAARARTCPASCTHPYRSVHDHTKDRCVHAPRRGDDDGRVTTATTTTNSWTAATARGSSNSGRSSSIDRRRAPWHRGAIRTAWPAADLRFEPGAAGPAPGSPRPRTAGRPASPASTSSSDRRRPGRSGCFPSTRRTCPWLRDRVARRRATADGGPVEVLHLFAYTGLTTLALARRGRRGRPRRLRATGRRLGSPERRAQRPRRSADPLDRRRRADLHGPGAAPRPARTPASSSTHRPTAMARAARRRRGASSAT